MTVYVSATSLHEIALETLQIHVPCVSEIRIARREGPLALGNWRIEWIDVVSDSYGPARDMADRLEAADDWIMVPDDHPLGSSGGKCRRPPAALRRTLNRSGG